MSLHNKPDYNSPAISAALLAHGMEVDTPSMSSDAFRLGYLAAQPGWQPQRCAECDCEVGGAACTWIRTPKFEDGV